MKKEEFIKRYGEAAYEKMLLQSKAWRQRYSEEMLARTRAWNNANSEKVKDHSHEQHRKGGKGYEKSLKYNHTGLQGERNKIRCMHAKDWRGFKHTIAPDSQIHHEWIPETAKYRGIALVETDQHMHGFIKVIQILKGKITLLTEDEVKGGSQNVCQAKTKSDC